MNLRGNRDGHRIRTIYHPRMGYQATNKHDINAKDDRDYTGLGNHVTVVNSGKGAGPFGGVAYVFNGAVQNTIPHSASHNNFTGSHTAMCWMRSRVAGQLWPMLICKGVVNTGYLLFFGTSEQIVYRITASPDRNATSAGGLIIPGKWQHLCGCYDTGDGYIRIYLDGIQVASTSVGSVTVNNNVNPLNLGGSTVSNYFDGDLSDISLWSRRLTEREVRDYVIWCKSGRPKASPLFAAAAAGGGGIPATMSQYRMLRAS